MSEKILLLLTTCIYPKNNNSNIGKERITQYINGFNKLFSYINILNDHNIDIYIIDNSINKNEKLPKEIIDIIPENIKIINDDKINNFGRINKGSGLIEQWLYSENIIKEYKWLIHFEPRQLLLNFNFINSFLENRRNLFTLGNGNNHFNTGLFCIKVNELIIYFKNIDLNYMINNNISIEYDLYNFIKINNILYDIREKMELLWHDNYINKYINM